MTEQLDGRVLKAPFPYFGGKSTVADVVWERFGDVPNYIEPFFGGGAVLLRRPHVPNTETVNDLDAMLANFWRAVKHDPEGVADYADWPVNETDLHARHKWLISQKASLAERLEADPDAYDAKIAGWWVWGMSLWIGGGFCRTPARQRPEIGHSGRAVHRKRPDLHSHGQGVAAKGSSVRNWMHALSDRLRRVRVTCGEWHRICGPSPTIQNGLTGAFFDPPYGAKAIRVKLYNSDSFTVADDVRAWCLEHGSNPMYRIALCGYDVEHKELESYGWTTHVWKTRGGYGNQGTGQGRDNAKRETIWFSPHCLDARQGNLF